MSRVGSVCLALVATAVTLSACGSDSSAADSGSTGDPCTEVQHEIDLVKALQQGATPSDPQGEIQRLSSFQPKAPTEVSRYYSTMKTYVVNHLERTVPDPPAAVLAANLDELANWKGAHCLKLRPSTSPTAPRSGT
ncbi:hypothetical protein [Nocardia yamanashiensis]|uniref:hypothetical protein n=1 Tax=Nocardia yamanashiensis TaxID=209247 RepID=UPI0008311EDF|nr:hypothetical protein [Nocardia yamanashiensis]